MADASFNIEYNLDLEPLSKLLSGVKRAGDFFVSGTAEIAMPKVEVDGVGPLSFPVPPSQIAGLIAHASRAPYGRGEETILDESVRKVWQLAPENVRIGGKSWAVNFANILNRVAAGLGCEGIAVSAELYKLLVYDTGGFFLPHRDTEKVAGMFGTLIVSLPCVHRGGELVIRHAGREVTVDMSEADFSEVSFAAFYADCEHELRPIADGSRVCLVFNLVQKTVAKRKAKAILAPDYQPQIAAVAALLGKSLTAPDAAKKIAWLLEHQYSPEGLSFAGLKSADAARASLLVQAAERADCAVHLGIVHIEESGSAEPVYGHYQSRHRGHFRDYDDDDDEEENEEDDSDDDFEVIDVCDWRHYVSQWRDHRDRQVALGEIPLEAGELLPDGALDGERPDEQRLMEASGNEGASFERSYHRAALVIWPRKRHAEVLLQAGVAAVLPSLQEKVAACAAHNAAPAARTEALALAQQVVGAWTMAERADSQQQNRPEKRDGMLQMLSELGDATLLERFTAAVVMRDYDGSENAALVISARLLGADKSADLLAELMRRHMRNRHGHCVALLCALTADNVPLKADWRRSLRQIAEAVVGNMDEVGKKARENDWLEWRWHAQPVPVDAALVANLLGVLGTLNAAALRIAAAESFAARPDVFDTVTVLVPALASLQTLDAAATRLWEHSADWLLQRSGHPPDAPTDWRQKVKLSCSCTDCRELQAFALDAVAQTHRFRVRKERRQHLHGQIEQHRLDMTHITDRKGSPQTLVCTKDRRSYQRRCNQYRNDIAALASLSAMVGKAKVSAGLKTAISAARARADAWQNSAL